MTELTNTQENAGMSYFWIFVAFTLRPLKHSSVKPKVQNVKTQMLARALVRSLSTVHKNSAYSVGEFWSLPKSSSWWRSNLSFSLLTHWFIIYSSLIFSVLIHFAYNHDLISHEHYLSSTLVSHALGLPNTNILKLGSWSMLWNADMFPYFHSFDFYNWPCSCKTPEPIFGGDHRLFGYIFTSMMQCSEKFAKKPQDLHHRLHRPRHATF